LVLHFVAAAMVYSQIATFAYEARVELSFFVGTASCQLYATALVVAILAKTLRVKLGICVLALCYFADYFPVSAFFDWLWLFVYNLFNLSDLLVAVAARLST